MSYGSLLDCIYPFWTSENWTALVSAIEIWLENNPGFTTDNNIMDSLFNRDAKEHGEAAAEERQHDFVLMLTTLSFGVNSLPPSPPAVAAPPAM
jgi:hypothetical protein